MFCNKGSAAILGDDAMQMMQMQNFSLSLYFVTCLLRELSGAASSYDATVAPNSSTVHVLD